MGKKINFNNENSNENLPDLNTDQKEEQTQISSEETNYSNIGTYDDTDYENEDEANDGLIELPDQDTPIVFFFGPPSVGKTMTLVRLSRYLHNNGYRLEADRDFRSGNSYQKVCDIFERNLSTNTALAGTDIDGFLLAKISHDKRIVCQILEAAGEKYFDMNNNSSHSFPPYMQKLFRTIGNRKIWVFITEEPQANNAYLKNRTERDVYIKKIHKCMNDLVKPQDAKIILYNKVDANSDLFRQGTVDKRLAEKRMLQKYNSIEKPFINDNPISRLWRKYNYKFVPFSTGQFNEDRDKTIYTESNDEYPAYLWKIILKCIKG